MTGDLIKKFLVGLGFGVDEKSLKTFNKAIDNAYVRVGMLATGIKAAAASVFYGISKISESFEEIGYQYRIIAPAINKALLLRKALMSAYKDAGINIVQAVQHSVKFNLSLTKTKYQLEGIARSVAVKFLPMLTKQMDEFRKKVSANMPKILAFLEKFVKLIFKASEAVTILAVRAWSILGRVWTLLEKLDDITGGWSTKIIAVIAAWKLLNLAFLTTPIGMIITGIVALLALFDDFMTWQEGGDSLFDWGAWVPAIEAFKKAIASTWEVLKQVWKTVTDMFGAFKKLFTGDFKGFFSSLGEHFKNVLGILERVWEVMKNVYKFGGSFGGGVIDTVKGLFGDTPALGSQPTGGTSQNVNQVNNFNVVTSDAPTAARLISNDQSRINANMTRNMKGAVR